MPGNKVSGLLVPRLYRSLLRISKKAEKGASNAFVASLRQSYYDRVQNVWLPLPKSPTDNEDGKQQKDEATLLAFRELTRRHTGENGMFFHPLASDKDTTILALVKATFRASPDPALSVNQRIDLAFVALRYLSRCVRVATQLAQAPAADHDSASGSGSGSGSAWPTRPLAPSMQLSVGCMLVAHPLLFERHSPLTQSCVLIVSHCDHLGTLGVVVNSPLHCTLGDRLNPDALQSLPHLKHFVDCELYSGGDVVLDRPVGLLHERPLTPPPTGTGPESGRNGSGAASSSASNGTRRRSRSSGSGSGSGSSRLSFEITFPAGPGDTPSGTLYFTSDLKWAAAEIEAGRACATDFKLLVGCAGWGVDQLRGECDMHTWFVCTGGHVRHFAMARTPLVRRGGASGHDAWCAALRGMGAEFAAYAAVGDYTRLVASEEEEDEREEEEDGSGGGSGGGSGRRALSDELHDLSLYGVDAELT